MVSGAAPSVSLLPFWACPFFPALLSVLAAATGICSRSRCSGMSGAHARGRGGGVAPCACSETAVMLKKERLYGKWGEGGCRGRVGCVWISGRRRRRGPARCPPIGRSPPGRHPRGHRRLRASLSVCGCARSCETAIWPRFALSAREPPLVAAKGVKKGRARFSPACLASPPSAIRHRVCVCARARTKRMDVFAPDPVDAMGARVRARWIAVDRRAAGGARWCADAATVPRTPPGVLMAALDGEFDAYDAHRRRAVDSACAIEYAPPPPVPLPPPPSSSSSSSWVTDAAARDRVLRWGLTAAAAIAALGIVCALVALALSSVARSDPKRQARHGDEDEGEA